MQQRCRYCGSGFARSLISLRIAYAILVMAEVVRVAVQSLQPNISSSILSASLGRAMATHWVEESLAVSTWTMQNPGYAFVRWRSLHVKGWRIVRVRVCTMPNPMFSHVHRPRVWLPFPISWFSKVAAKMTFLELTAHW